MLGLCVHFLCVGVWVCTVCVLCVDLLRQSKHTDSESDTNSNIGREVGGREMGLVEKRKRKGRGRSEGINEEGGGGEKWVGGEGNRKGKEK